jgi:hypothetical protein
VDFPRRGRRRDGPATEAEAADLEIGIDVDAEDLADGPVAASRSGVE